MPGILRDFRAGMPLPRRGALEYKSRVVVENVWINLKTVYTQNFLKTRFVSCEGSFVTALYSAVTSNVIVESKVPGLFQLWV